MQGQVALVTGSRTGVGRALAEHFCARGATVYGCSRTMAEWSLQGYEHLQADVADEQAVRELMTTIRKRHGRLDVLINNAGIGAMNHLILTPMEQVQRVLQTNLLGCFLVCREGAKLLRHSGNGRIVNLSTVAVPLALAGEAAYVAAKSGVVGLTQVLARELADFGITVNAIGPAPIDTDLLRGVTASRIDEILSRQAIHRMGTMADVTNVVDFLIRKESSFITGQTVYLGGVW